ncbi:unnamed protein product [Linum tenue]|uniref:Uncharacterized protein n=1 Tax=Linum tenue TaxID=586396 RepID=A0AAV0M4D9_9ROSI|nr:unnamed protein product [Linum tenue]
MTNHDWKKSFESFVRRHIDQEKDEQLKGNKEERTEKKESVAHKPSVFEFIVVQLSFLGFVHPIDQEQIEKEEVSATLKKEAAGTGQSLAAGQGRVLWRYGRLQSPRYRTVFNLAEHLQSRRYRAVFNLAGRLQSRRYRAVFKLAGRLQSRRYRPVFNLAGRSLPAISSET